MKFKLNTFKFLTEDLKERQTYFNNIKDNWDEFVNNAKIISELKTNADSEVEITNYLSQLQDKFEELQRLTSKINSIEDVKKILKTCDEYLTIGTNLLNDKERISYQKLLKNRTNNDKEIIKDLNKAKNDLAKIKAGELDIISQEALIQTLVKYISNLHYTLTTNYEINQKQDSKAQDIIKRGEQSKELRQSILNSTDKINLDKVEVLLNNFPTELFTNDEEVVKFNADFESTLKAISDGITFFNRKTKTGKLSLSRWIVGDGNIKFLTLFAKHLNNLISMLDIIDNQRKRKIELKKLDDLGSDWDQKYADCKTEEDYNAFWDSYFSEVWGEYGQYVRYLNGFMRSLIDTKDWTSNSNQYIREIRRIINNESTKEIVKTKSFNNYFILIIDAGKRGNRSRSLLGELGKYDIVLNSSFYKINLVDAEKYLDFQSDFINNAKSVDNKYYQEPIVYMWAYISLTTGSSKTYKNPPKDPTNIALSTFGRAKDKSNVIGFKSMTTYGKNEKIATDKTVQTIISKVKSNPEQAKELISYITIVYKSQFSNLFDNYENKTLLDKYKEQYSEISKSDAALFDEYLEIKKNIKYSEAQMKALLNGLLNITDPQEAKENK